MQRVTGFEARSTLVLVLRCSRSTLCGITALVLKYRVLQTTPDHIGGLFKESVSRNHEEPAPVFPLAVADLRTALN